MILQARVALQQILGRAQSVAHRHPDVHQHDVGAGRRHDVSASSPSLASADDGDAGVAAEHHAAGRRAPSGRRRRWPAGSGAGSLTPATVSTPRRRSRRSASTPWLIRPPASPTRSASPMQPEAGCGQRRRGAPDRGGVADRDGQAVVGRPGEVDRDGRARCVLAGVGEGLLHDPVCRPAGGGGQRRRRRVRRGAPASRRPRSSATSAGDVAEPGCGRSGVPSVGWVGSRSTPRTSRRSAGPGGRCPRSTWRRSPAPRRVRSVR